MRIGLVIERFDPRRGGVEQWTYRYAQMLIAWGHEVHVVAMGFGEGLAADGLVRHELPPASSRLQFAEAAERRMQGLALDVVHDTGCGQYGDVFQPHGGSRKAAFEQNLLLLPPPLRPLKRRLAAWLPRYRQFERLLSRQYVCQGRIFVAISQMVARDMQRYHGVREDAIRLVYNGVDVERFSPRHRATHRAVVREGLGVRDEEVLLLIVAHNFALKGVPTLIRAVGQLVALGNPVRLVVAGGKPSRRYQRLARSAGAAAAVTFVGAVDDPVPYFAAADVYVQPTFYDPCSLVVLEALASGLPVVTSRFNGAGELIHPGREGFLIDDPADADELTQALRPLLDASTRDRFGIAARSLAEDHPFERNCREMLAVYEQARGSHRRAA